MNILDIAIAKLLAGGGGSGTVTSVSVQGGSGSHLTGSGNPIETSGTITINVDEGYSIPSNNKQTAWDGKATDLKADIDSSTYVMTLQLKDSAGNLIGSEKTIDLPLETMVVDGTYDPQTQKIKLELKNGNFVEFSVADLVSGLQTELSSSNKLNPDYITYDASHRAVSDTEKDTWNGKQNAISDLETIRSGAAAGATAVQPSEMNSALATKQNTIDSSHKLASSLVSFGTAEATALASGIDSTKVEQIGTNQTNILYTLGKTGKNIFNFKPNGNTSGFLNDDDEIIIMPRTYMFSFKATSPAASSSYSLTFRDASDAIVKTVSGGVATSVSKEFTISESEYSQIKTVRFYINSAAASITEVMICSSDDWNKSSDYQPYGGIPNYDLTRLEAEDRAALAEEIDAGAKNKLDWASATYLSSINCTYSKTNTSLTASAGSSELDSMVFYSVGTFAAGNYVFKFKISSAAITQEACIYVSTSTAASTAIASIQITANGEYELPFSWSGGTVYLKFFPNITHTASSNTFTVSDLMVCTKAAFGVSNKFVPYRPNYDLVCMSVPKTAQSTVNFSTANTYTYTGLSFTIPADQSYIIIGSISWNTGQPTELILSDASDVASITRYNTYGRTDNSGDTGITLCTVTAQIIPPNSDTTMYLYAKNASSSGKSSARLTVIRIA